MLWLSVIFMQIILICNAVHSEFMMCMMWHFIWTWCLFPGNVVSKLPWTKIIFKYNRGQSLSAINYTCQKQLDSWVHQPQYIGLIFQYVVVAICSQIIFITVARGLLIANHHDFQEWFWVVHSSDWRMPYIDQYYQLHYTLPAKNMEYVLFHRFFAFLRGVQGVFVL